MKPYSVIGTRVPNVDAYVKATGEAVYTMDVDLPGLLVGKILRSSVPHARILNIDTSRAKRIPGVKAVITAEDTPKIKFGRMGKNFDKLPLENQKVRCIGDEIAAVAAVDGDAAREALAAIKVDFEELPAVFDSRRAMDNDAPLIHENREDNISLAVNLNYGDLEEGFTQADLLLEEEFHTPPQSHACLETHNIVTKLESDGRVTIWAATQGTHVIKQSLAAVCGLAPERLRIIKPHVGGSFGSKANCVPMDAIAVFLTLKTGRPVRMEYSYHEEFFAGTPRHPTISWLKYGFSQDGLLLAKQASVIMDNGAYNITGPAILTYSSYMLSLLYRCPNLQYKGLLVYTNKTPNASFRGFGTPQATFPQEIMMDMAAEKLGLDPKKLRLINANQANDVAVGKVRITSCGLCDTINRAADEAGWDEKRIQKKPGRGIGMASMIYTGAGSNIFGDNYAGVNIKLNVEGSISLNLGACDIGQGSNTVLLQMAADVLGIPLEEIQLCQGDTDLTPTDYGTKGSRMTFCAGLATVQAAQDVCRQIMDLAGQILNVNPRELDRRGKEVFVANSPDERVSLAEIAHYSFFTKNQPVIGHGFFNQQKTDTDPQDSFGYPFPAMIFATQIAEVEVDEHTGVVNVVRMVCAHDVGRIINPLLAEGQLEGGVVQGMGFALSEDVVYDQGRFVNDGLTDYIIPTSRDIPEIEALWVESNDPNGPYGSKGLAEAANSPTAPAIINAIYDAVGVRITSLPATSEKILAALKGKRFL